MVPQPAIAYNKAAVNNAQEVAGVTSSMLFNVESMSAVHNTDAGRWWWNKISELGFKEFLNLRDGRFRGGGGYPPTQHARRAPPVIPMNAVPLLEGDSSPVGIRLSRMITQKNTGSRVMFGVAQMAPGERSRLFSFREHDDTVEGEAYYGPIDETFFVVRGRLRIECDDGELEAGPQESIHLPPGNKYRMINPAMRTHSLYTRSLLPSGDRVFQHKTNQRRERCGSGVRRLSGCLRGEHKRKRLVYCTASPRAACALIESRAFRTRSGSDSGFGLAREAGPHERKGHGRATGAAGVAC